MESKQPTTRAYAKLITVPKGTIEARSTIISYSDLREINKKVSKEFLEKLAEGPLQVGDVVLFEDFSKEAQESSEKPSPKKPQVQVGIPEGKSLGDIYTVDQLKKLLVPQLKSLASLLGLKVEKPLKATLLRC